MDQLWWQLSESFQIRGVPGKSYSFLQQVVIRYRDGLERTSRFQVSDEEI
jgi:hypothetical protein